MPLNHVPHGQRPGKISSREQYYMCHRSVEIVKRPVEHGQWLGMNDMVQGLVNHVLSGPEPHWQRPGKIPVQSPV